MISDNSFRLNKVSLGSWKILKDPQRFWIQCIYEGYKLI